MGKTRDGPGSLHLIADFGDAATQGAGGRLWEAIWVGVAIAAAQEIYFIQSLITSYNNGTPLAKTIRVGAKNGIFLTCGEGQQSLTTHSTTHTTNTKTLPTGEGV